MQFNSNLVWINGNCQIINGKICWLIWVQTNKLVCIFCLQVVVLCDLIDHNTLGNVIIIVDRKKNKYLFYCLNCVVVWLITCWSRSDVCSMSASTDSLKNRGFNLHDMFCTITHFQKKLFCIAQPLTTVQHKQFSGEKILQSMSWSVTLLICR